MSSNWNSLQMTPGEKGSLQQDAINRVMDMRRRAKENVEQSNQYLSAGGSGFVKQGTTQTAARTTAQPMRVTTLPAAPAATGSLSRLLLTGFLPENPNVPQPLLFALLYILL